MISATIATTLSYVYLLLSATTFADEQFFEEKVGNVTIGVYERYKLVAENEVYIRFGYNSPWTYFTYMLIPTHFVHVLSTCAVQIFLGVPLELVHGSLRVFTLYVIGITTASMFNFILTPASVNPNPHSLDTVVTNILRINTEQHVFLGGASGGCYALIGAWLANVLLNADVMSAWGFLARLLPMTMFILFDLPITVLAALIYKPNPAFSLAALPPDHVLRTIQTMLAALGIFDFHYWTTPLIGFTFGASCGFLFLKSFQELITWELCCSKFLLVTWSLIISALIVCQIVPIKIDCVGAVPWLNVTSSCSPVGAGMEM